MGLITGFGKGNEDMFSKIGRTLIWLKMSNIQRDIFYTIKKEWEKRVGRGNVDEVALARIILISDTDRNGYKKITNIGTGKTHLVPIEDIILDGIKGFELDKYPEAKKDENINTSSKG